MIVIVVDVTGLQQLIAFAGFGTPMGMCGSVAGRRRGIVHRSSMHRFLEELFLDHLEGFIVE